MKDRAAEDGRDHHEQRERDAVGHEVVVRLEQEVPEPRVVLLIRGCEAAALAEPDLPKHREERRHEEADTGAGERDGAYPSALLLVAFGEEHRDQRKEQWRPDDGREDHVHARCTHRCPVAASTDSSTRIAMTTRLP